MPATRFLSKKTAAPLTAATQTQLLRLECRGFAAADDDDDEPRIDRTGGDYSAGIIRGYAVASVGESTGHNEVLDHTTIDQIVDLGQAAVNGIKSRFAHPNLSADGMGKQLGRAKNFRRDGDVARADLHFFKSARKAPQGDLGGFVMDLADEDPDVFGTSVVIMRDLVYRLNEDGTPQLDDDGNRLHPLIRVKSLLASDVVDEPAANVGFFSRDLPDAPSRLATQFLDRVFGGLDDNQLQIKVNEFLTRYLSHRNFEDLTMSERQRIQTETEHDSAGATETTATPATEVEAAAAEASPQQLEERGRLTERSRVNKIHALCDLAGCPDKAKTFVDGEFSVAETQTALSEILDKRNLSLAGENAAADIETERDDNKPFRDEFKQHAQQHARMGVTEDMYISSRRIDEGLEQLVAGSKAV